MVLICTAAALRDVIDMYAKVGDAERGTASQHVGHEAAGAAAAEVI